MASGIGLTVTSTVIDVPLQPLAEGVIVYLTMTGVFELLVSICEILVPLPLENPEAEPLWIEAIHEKIVPATLLGLLMLMLVVAPLQMDWEVGFAAAFGIGFTVTSTLMGIPGQPFADGVIVYLTTAGVLVLFDKICEILVPVPPENPVTAPLCRLAVHENIVPTILFGLVMLIFVDVPLHIGWLIGLAVTLGTALIVIFEPLSCPVIGGLVLTTRILYAFPASVPRGIVADMLPEPVPVRLPMSVAVAKLPTASDN